MEQERNVEPKLTLAYLNGVNPHESLKYNNSWIVLSQKITVFFWKGVTPYVPVRDYPFVEFYSNNPFATSVATQFAKGSHWRGKFCIVICFLQTGYPSGAVDLEGNIFGCSP